MHVTVPISCDKKKKGKISFRFLSIAIRPHFTSFAFCIISVFSGNTQVQIVHKKSARNKLKLMEENRGIVLANNGTFILYYFKCKCKVDSSK